jgi:transposase
MRSVGLDQPGFHRRPSGDDIVPTDNVCRVIDAFVDGLNMNVLGFERGAAADTGRPGYDPRDLLKLYLYGYLNQIRSSRRLETAAEM